MKNEKQKIFDGLVKNGLSFIELAIKQLEDNSNLSIILFCSGIELLLKARIFKEHWSLIIDGKPQPFSSLIDGTAKTIDMTTAIDVIEQIIRTQMKDETKEALDTIREARNRNIHFVPTDNQQEKEEIVTTLLESWYYIHALITQKWREEFAGHLDTISACDRAVHELNQYLRVKFEQLQPKLQGLAKSSRYIVHTCPFCEYKALVLERSQFPELKAKCEVCNNDETFLAVSCHKCQEINVYSSGKVFDLTRYTCSKCDEHFEFENLVTQGIHPTYISVHQLDLEDLMKFKSYNIETEEIVSAYLIETYDPREFVDTDNIHCLACQYTDLSVLYLHDGTWGCVECGTRYDYSEVHQCDYCFEYFASTDLEAANLTMLFGCGRCEGRQDRE